MTVADTIEQKLTETLSPSSLEVIDESHKHAGHAGSRPEGETHFRVEIIAPVFEGKSRVERQRLVYGVLSEEMAGPIHALALKTLSPSEIA
ncbi:MAG: BolA family transcriptional regulator [Rhodospirillaceae bacterium]|nr:BolA family transcriptional regulator [Rhodospirillaceae bacterium]MBT4219422.1 BolA family transcriptional regulator [Rhodospirillaceae bacterium]MBT4463901.1 BolA family transcriptional regulator [Rhodospirillaceae bacterium]MBT5013112.1 BolA family transcriptional regulator [Rhodospirillaceae bacterium]MBT5308543.1 BolA family transcriptional regulator [Rhodospirillaceae bacterium]